MQGVGRFSNRKAHGLVLGCSVARRPLVDVGFWSVRRIAGGAATKQKDMLAVAACRYMPAKVCTFLCYAGSLMRYVVFVVLV